MTGKTLLAFKVAKQATNNKWTFIYLKDPKLLSRTLQLSKTLDKSGHGIIVFVEDIDQVTTGDRDAAMQDILNTLDGGDTKGMNVIAMFTTNHIKQINPTFLRGKRIGSIISMGALNATTAMQFLHHTFDKDYILETEGLDKVCKDIEDAGIVPAFMAEITEKVKSNMVFEDDNVVKAKYLAASLEAYKRQVALARTQDMSQTDDQLLAMSLRKVLFAAPVENNKLDLIKEACCD